MRAKPALLLSALALLMALGGCAYFEKMARKKRAQKRHKAYLAALAQKKPFQACLAAKKGADNPKLADFAYTRSKLSLKLRLLEQDDLSAMLGGPVHTTHQPSAFFAAKLSAKKLPFFIESLLITMTIHTHQRRWVVSKATLPLCDVVTKTRRKKGRYVTGKTIPTRILEGLSLGFYRGKTVTTWVDGEPLTKKKGVLSSRLYRHFKGPFDSFWLLTNRVGSVQKTTATLGVLSPYKAPRSLYNPPKAPHKSPGEVVQFRLRYSFSQVGQSCSHWAIKRLRMPLKKGATIHQRLRRTFTRTLDLPR